MKNALLSFIVLLNFEAFSIWNSDNSALFTNYGMYRFRLPGEDLDDFKSAFENKAFPSKLNFYGFIIAGGEDLDSTFTKHPWFIPKKIWETFSQMESSVGVNWLLGTKVETTEGNLKLSGFMVNGGLFGMDLLPRTRHFDFVPHLAYSFVRIKARFNGDKSINTFQNYGFGMDFRLCLENLALNFRYQYKWDISKSDWSNNFTPAASLRGSTISLGVGWHFPFN